MIDILGTVTSTIGSVLLEFLEWSNGIEVWTPCRDFPVNKTTTRLKKDKIILANV